MTVDPLQNLENSLEWSRRDRSLVAAKAVTTRSTCKPETGLWYCAGGGEASGHGHDKESSLFRPIRNNRTGTVDRPLFPDGVYKIMRGYSAKLGIPSSPHVARAMAATNAYSSGCSLARGAR
jgi:hypothetical protein